MFVKLGYVQISGDNMSDQTSSVLIFFVNGKKVIDKNVDPELTLLYYLREKLRLCGTKLGCSEGGCGACTVMVSRHDQKTGNIIHLAVNACLTPICSMHGLSVTTVEGIGSTRTKLHPVQERIAKAHGSQCGFCTPGMVMSMYALLRSQPKPTMEDIETSFQGNLCRCTGYRPIIDGLRTFCENWEERQQTSTNSLLNGVCSLGIKCCRNGSNNVETGELFSKSEFLPYDQSQEVIFPPELKIDSKLDTEYLSFKGERVTWYRPTSVQSLLDLKSQYPNSRIIAGNTEIGVEIKFKNCVYPILIQIGQISELKKISSVSSGLQIGASVTLTELETALNAEIKTQSETRTRIFSEILKMLHWFAGKQIRNVASVGGNIMTCSPISDLNPIFAAAGCKLEVESKERGKRVLNMDRSFFTGYRKNLIQSDEILLNITIPFTDEDQYFLAFKQAKRREDDIAIVNSAFNIWFKPSTTMIKDLNIAYGGMAPMTVMPQNIKKKLIDRLWDDDILEDAYNCLIEDLPLAPGAPGGMSQYRKSLTLSMFFKAYLNIRQRIIAQNKVLDSFPEEHMSATRDLPNEVPQNSQYFQVVPKDQNQDDILGRPIPHKSAYKHATGEAIYCDDVPHYEGELYLALVLSTRAHAKIISIDADSVIQMDGVHAFLSAKDLPNKSFRFGGFSTDEEVFVSEKVISQGQIIGAVVADNQIIAQRAAKLVKIVYEDLSPVIITIPDAIKEKSFYSEYKSEIVDGDVEAAFRAADHILTGEVRSGGQEHFYLETQCSLAIPKKEDNEMELIASTQYPTQAQNLVAEMLGLPFNKVVCHIKRVGGGFGGKSNRSMSLLLPVALAAYKLNRPVRCMLDRDEDMMMTGQRHPFLSKYKASFTKEGKITGFDIEIFNNAGHTLDYSVAVLRKAIFHIVNAYKIPNVRVIGYSCKTNIPSNTAFRGFGAPQGMLCAETIIRHVADFLQKDPFEIISINMCKEGDLTIFKQPIINCRLQSCWDECLRRSNYLNKLKEVAEFNIKNRWKKRGLSIVPTMYGISYDVEFLNQAGALIMVYTDGSVLLTHGGIEMGQGLHTKMIQVASRILQIPDSYIHIADTSTDKVPNASPTSGSTGTDLNGMAVVNACEIIMERLQPIKAEYPNGSWKEWIEKAYYKRISLSATGFYKTPVYGYNWNTNEGNPYNYFVFGVGCSEVEIDCLTGDHKVLQTDIVMDAGESINPGIDIGQIEGAFAHGYGFFTLEETIMSPTGTLYSKGPGAYKIPGFGDIPTKFNVALLKGVPNTKAIFSSKATGEPPLFLSASVFFAIKSAIAAARKDSGIEGWFPFDAPATAARIRMACADNITKKFAEEDPTSYVPWNVVL